MYPCISTLLPYCDNPLFQARDRTLRSIMVHKIHRLRGGMHLQPLAHRGTALPCLSHPRYGQSYKRNENKGAGEAPTNHHTRIRRSLTSLITHAGRKQKRGKSIDSIGIRGTNFFVLTYTRSMREVVICALPVCLNLILQDPDRPKIKST